jgi:hypothetical protein
VTGARWISDGSEVPEGSVALKPPPARRAWHLGRFELARTPGPGRWSCSTAGEPGIREDGRVMAGTLPAAGVAGARTPLGAFFALLRLLRER